MSDNKIKKELELNGKKFSFFSLKEASKVFGKDISKLPYSLKILLENILRCDSSNLEAAKAVINSVKDAESRIEIAFSPARVLMQDFTGVPAVVDLAAMRDAVVKAGGNPKRKNTY